MKNLFLVMMAFLASFTFYSCDPEEILPDEELPDEFSEYTVEENKAQLEENGIDFINAVEDLKDHQSFDAVVNLADLLSYMDTEEDPIGGRLITTLAQYKAGKASVKDIYSSMRLNDAPPSDEPESIQEFFDIYGGTYNWVAETEEWDFTEGNQDIVLNFPSVEGGADNDATLTIKDYEGKTQTNPLDEDYSGDIPTNLIIELHVEEALVLSFDFSADYNSKGEPTSLHINLAIPPFAYSINQSNNSSKISVDYSFKKDNDVLLAFSASANGNFDSDLIEDAEDIEDSDEIIHDATASFQAMNIKVSGEIDVKNLIPEIDQIDYSNEDAAVEKEAELLNKYYEVVVFYADNNLKIADTEFYTFPDTEWEYNPETYEYEEVEVLSLGMRLVFADGSKADFEDYFENGFEDFTDEFDALIESLEE